MPNDLNFHKFPAYAPLHVAVAVSPTHGKDMNVKLIRVDPATGEPVTNTVDVSKVRVGDKSKDILLQDGDRIEVPPINHE